MHHLCLRVKTGTRAVLRNPAASRILATTNLPVGLTVNDPNPYTAPEASLETDVRDETYRPKVFTFHGRIGRLRFITYFFCAALLILLAFLPLFFISFGTGILAGEQPEVGVFAGIVVIAFNIVAAIIMIMFGKRRLNDLNRSGWFVLIYFAPVLFVLVEDFSWVGELISFLLWIYLLYFPGTSTPNNFGAMPVENSIFTKIVGLLLHVLIIFSLIFGLLALLGAGFLPAQV